MEQERVITPTIDRILKKKQKRLNGQFIKGPISLLWVIEMCKLSKNAMKVALAIRHLDGIFGGGWFELNNKNVSKLQLTRDAKRKGLMELEKSELVEVEKRTGKSPRVKVVEISN